MLKHALDAPEASTGKNGHLERRIRRNSLIEGRRRYRDRGLGAPRRDGNENARKA
jgi:hypothetical protein